MQLHVKDMRRADNSEHLVTKSTKNNFISAKSQHACGRRRRQLLTFCAGCSPLDTKLFHFSTGSETL